MGAHHDIELSEINVQDGPEPSEVKKHGRAATPPTSRTTRLARRFNFYQLYFFTLGFLQSWEAVGTNLGFSFLNGGPAATFFGMIFVMAVTLLQVLSIAEIASAQPIAGAQYHWTWQWAPENLRRSITWLQGWVTVLSWTTLLASVVNIVANVIAILVAESLGLELQPWAKVLIIYALLVVSAFVNAYAFWIVPWIELAAGLLHVFFFIVVAIVLLVLGPRHSPRFVFTSGSSLSGWDSFTSTNIGLTYLTWPFVGFEAVSHLSEEIKHARKTAPRAMVFSVSTNSFIALCMIVVFLFTAGDVDRIVSAVYPLMDMFEQATGVTASCALVGCILIVLVSGLLGSVASVARLTWAWARDGGLPEWVARVDPKQRIPLNAVPVPIGLVMILALFNLGIPLAFNGIISLTTFGLYQSYIITIGCIVHARWQNRFHKAPWSLGKYGLYINVGAMAGSLWLAVFMLFPSSVPVTAANMNYALPMSTLVWIFAFGSWYGWAKQNWPGPSQHVIEDVLDDADRTTKD